MAVGLCEWCGHCNWMIDDDFKVGLDGGREEGSRVQRSWCWWVVIMFWHLISNIKINQLGAYTRLGKHVWPKLCFMFRFDGRWVGGEYLPSFPQRNEMKWVMHYGIKPHFVLFVNLVSVQVKSDEEGVLFQVPIIHPLIVLCSSCATPTLCQLQITLLSRLLLLHY